MPQKNKLISKFPYLAILVVAFVVSYSYTFDSKVAILGDNASYYMLGKALAQGEGYVNIFRTSHSPNNHYPPGYPAIISVVMLFTSSIIAIKIVNGLFFLGALFLLFQLFLHITESQRISFVVTSLVLINAHLLFYSSIMMSEIPFLFFSVLSLLCFAKIRKLSFRDPYLIICLISLIISYYIRSLGVALLGGYFLHLIIQKRWKFLATFFLTFVAGALPWFIRSQKLGGGSYLKQLTMVNPYNSALGTADFGDYLERVVNNFSRYVTREIPSAIFPIKEPAYSTPLNGGEWFMGLLIISLLAYGIYALPKFRWLMAGYLLSTFGILMIWPEVWIGVRFIVAIIPILMLGLFYGMVKLMNEVRKSLGKLRPANAYYFLFFALLYIEPVSAIHEQAKTPYSPGWKNYFEIAKWLNSKVDKSVVVACAKPSLFYLYSDTYTMRYEFTQNGAELIEDLEKNKVDYVVIDQVYGNTFRYLLPAIRQYPERFEQIYHLKNPDSFLLKFKR